MPEKPPWRRRWLVVRLALGFSALVIAYVTFLGADDNVRETALLGAFSLAGAVVLGYLGFATKDDADWLKLTMRAPK